MHKEIINLFIPVLESDNMVIGTDETPKKIQFNH